MKILCETVVQDRQTQRNRTPRYVKSTLAVGYNNSAKDADGNNTKHLEIMLFTPQNQAGERFKVTNNVEKIFSKFLRDGKVTISFKEPPLNLMINCDPIQLKGFLQTIKLGLEGKDSINLRLNIAAATAIPQRSKPQEKMTVLRRGDYPVKGFPRSLKSLKISNIQLLKISFDICSLRNLTVLDLSDNQISRVPREMGRLSLVCFTVNNNQLGTANDWEWLRGKQIRKSLRELDLSANEISYFPLDLIRLEQLVGLKMSNNKIPRLPFGFRRLCNLRNLYIASNLLTSLPSDFNHMRIVVLDVWGNKFGMKVEHHLSEENNKHSTPSLWLLSARAVCQYKLPYSAATIPWLLTDILAESPLCACGKVCFDNVIFERAVMATLDNIKTLVSSREHLIYADIVLCGAGCSGRKQLLSYEQP
ncbi:PREDICTED: leucine-rich repeat protein 1 [Rhagoletis zephyria]|uniref:leucine-rich repeat protein 1 n=1 Tax=Rhagoletis zephyria TaxID=28612 RepID=UPI0008115AB6|nr:PREDICTED: leucine-rich repeat protein 1 [Rhagoletis zephyria]